MAKPGLFGMLDLSIREWVPVETYGGILLPSNDEFLSKDFCQKNSHFPELYEKISNTICSILLLNMPLHAMSDFNSQVKIPTRSRIMMF